ncbi:hypothetical protein KUTeg_021671 [Tegillarca granosa]|uniref:Uncharacterized protein n=1 Tax=Tegillarca granosa TaxID=220873 RepID=A0ABQ9E8E6_TEGGR|nr:hypothetical protein KUTeg_021671 [Tegillarca granosa]
MFTSQKMPKRASPKAKSIHTRLLTEISNYVDPRVNQHQYDQTLHRLRDLLKPIEQKQSKNIMDILECLEKRGIIAVGNYSAIRDRLNEFDVELGGMIDDAVEEINKIENQNGASSSDSSFGDKEHKEKKDSEDHVGGASPKKRSKLGKPKYDCEDNQRGLILVFNFKKDRYGTDLDVEKIRCFFETDLKFEFELCEDFNKQQVIDKLEEYKKDLSSNRTAKGYYCFFIVMMGHGKEDHIMTADDDNNTYLEFDTSCRGAVTQKTVDLPDEPPEDEIHPPEVIVEKLTIPIDSDTLIAHATTPGTKAFRRHGDVGAWFIDAFIEVCKDSYGEDHLEEMLISVREKIAYGKHYRTNAGGCQMPCVWTTLTKRLFLEKP